MDQALTWFSYALGDLAAARSHLATGSRPRIIAFHANRAAKNALIAALVFVEIDPPRTDDVEDLRVAMPSAWGDATAHALISRLARFGTTIAYPGPGTAVTRRESAGAVRDASAVLTLVQEDFERRGVSTEGLVPR